MTQTTTEKIDEVNCNKLIWRTANKYNTKIELKSAQNNK